MADTPFDEQLAPKDPKLFQEAQQLLSVPPVPSTNPTDSFWGHFESPLNEEQLSLTKLHSSPLEPDAVVIIGGGLTGVSVAYWLTEFGVPGDTILLVEGRGLGDGASGRNGGHCWPSTRVWNEKQLAQYGRENLERAEEWKFRSAELFMKWLEDNHIDCDLRRTGCCELTTFQEEISEFKEYLDDKAARFDRLGTTTELWDSEETNRVLFGGSWKGGMFQSLAGQFWPRKAVHGIANIAMSRGVRIRTHTYVEEIERTVGGSFLLRTKSGDIHARKLVHCTNGYASKLLPQLKGAIVPVRGQVVATSPVRTFSIPHNLGFNDGYEYLIHRKEDGRIIFGGNRWRSLTVGREVGVCDDSSLDPLVSEGLRGSLPEIFPMLKSGVSIDYEWTGIMGYSCDNWPLIGRLNLQHDEWIAAGYSGNGMPQCFGAAKAVSEMITGKMSQAEQWIPQFNPQRFEDSQYAARHIYTGRKPLKMEE